MGSHTKIQLQIMLQTLDLEPTRPNIKICTTHFTKSLSCDNIKKLFDSVR